MNFSIGVAETIQDSLRQTDGKSLITATGRTFGGPDKYDARGIFPYNALTESGDELRKLLEGRGIANLDEVHRIIDGNPYLNESLSYAHYMRQRLFQPLGLSENNWIMPDGRTGNVKGELQKWRLKLKDTVFGTAMFGIGPDPKDGHNGSAHLAFMPENVRPNADVLYVELDTPTRIANSSDGNPDHYFAHAFSMGPLYPLYADNVILAANRKKSHNVHGVLFNRDVRAFLPASMVLTSPNVTILLDNEAAEKVLQEIKSN